MKDLISQIQVNINKYPDTTIIVDQEENHCFTYRSFNEFARKIASKLNRMGVGKMIIRCVIHDVFGSCVIEAVNPAAIDLVGNPHKSQCDHKNASDEHDVQLYPQPDPAPLSPCIHCVASPAFLVHPPMLSHAVLSFGISE